ncbi:MAG: ABC transporter permease [Hyphomicrobiaceae bacterium]
MSVSHSLDAVGPEESAAANWYRPYALMIRFAMREMRAGLGGFGIFIACIALGVGVITGVSALTDALLNGFAAQGRQLLGGDVVLRRVHQRATDKERAVMNRLGRTSEMATMRSMARLPDGDDQALVEIKAVDSVYPLLGGLRLGDDRAADAALRQTNGAIVAQTLLDRLNLKVGDSIKLGQTPVPITGTIAKEPDKITARLAFGPRVMVSHDTLAATGLVRPGTLINWRYAIVTPDADAAPVETVLKLRKAVKSDLGESGFIVRDRRDPSPSITRLLDRLKQFLTLLGLAALMIGGVGVANAVQTFVDRRRRVIATYKSVGATNGMVLGIYLVQVLLISGVGTVLGVVVGNVVPAALSSLYGAQLPIELGASFSWANVGVGLVYGLLVTLLFVLWPLGQADRIRPAALFRDEVDGTACWPRGRILVCLGAVAVALIGFAAWATGAPKLAAGFLGGMLAIFAVFWLIGFAVTWGARRVPRPRRPELALAITGLAAPGGLARSVVLSLGAGLSLLVAVALVDASLVDELRGRMPENSPHYFALDIPKPERDVFVKEIRAASSDANIEMAPMLRGRIVRLNGVEADKAKIDPEAQWVLNGDRGLTYSETLPKGSKLVAGKWWDAAVSGEPQVSFAAKLAGEMNLGVGDTVTVNILGRNITARITSLREIEWESLAINFVMVFSPNTLKAAPHNLLATVRFPDATPQSSQAAAARALGKRLPNVTMINVRDAINAFAEVFGKVMIAVRVAAGITLLAGALVLAGALATAQRRRILQAVVLKCIGATRRKLLLSHFAEYGLLALLTAAVALAVGTIAAWVVTSQVLDATLVFSWLAVAGALAVSVALILAFGAFGTWRVLAAKPLPVLRGL